MFWWASSGMFRLKNAPWSLTTLQLLPPWGGKATQTILAPFFDRSPIFWWHSSGMFRLKNAPWSLTTLQRLPPCGGKATQATPAPFVERSLIFWWHSSGMFRLKNTSAIAMYLRRVCGLNCGTAPVTSASLIRGLLLPRWGQRHMRTASVLPSLGWPAPMRWILSTHLLEPLLTCRESAAPVPDTSTFDPEPFDQDTFLEPHDALRGPPDGVGPTRSPERDFRDAPVSWQTRQISCARVSKDKRNGLDISCTMTASERFPSVAVCISTVFLT